MISIVSYGGGTNSTAMLVGLLERGERPDRIVFSDTGGEKPHTYEHIETVSQWCKKIGFPEVTIVKGSQPSQLRRGSLEAECLELGTLPSKAYGFGNCSQKWKIDPAKKYDRALADELGIALSDIARLVGFDADEPHRMERAIRAQPKDHQAQRFPLVEWDWGREECIEAIARAGLPQPGKSACFYCPSSKKWEILDLRERYPDLFARACEMERRALAGEGQAPATTAKGLGRSFSWAEFVKQHDEALAKQVAFTEAQLCLFSDNGIPEVDCGCYDG